MPGTTVSLSGSGFQSATQVELNGLSASITLNTATQVNFTVPANATSGFAAIRVNNVWYTNPAPFTVKRAIQGTFNPPAGISRTGYRVEAGGNFAAVDATTGEFAGAVEKDEVALLWAFRNGSAPAFLALVHPATNEVTIDAASTAEALVLINPAINARAFQRYTNFVGPLRSSAQFTTLVAAIQNASSGGRDYLDDAAVETAWGNAVEFLLNLPAQAPLRMRNLFESGTPSGTKLRYLDPPETSAGNVGLRRLKADLAGPNSKHPDDFLMGFDSAGRFAPVENPLDWFVKIYELDPFQFTNGLESVSELGAKAKPNKLSYGVVDSAAVTAKLFSKNLDLLDIAAGALMDVLFARNVDGALFALKPNEAKVPALRPGVYLAESFSGNLYNGVEFLSGTNGQSQLITDINGRTEWAIALGGNIFVAAVDLVSGIGGIRELMKESRGAGGSNEEKTSARMEILKGVAEDVAKGLAVHGNAPLTTDFFYDLLKNAASSLVKNISAYALQNPEFAGVEEYGEKVIKTVGKSLDVLSKFSAALQGIERAGGLLTSSVLALERSVVVVGNPFAPRIQSFFPQSGRGGETLTIQGANFGTTTNGLSVSFRQYASTDDPTAFTARLELEVLTNTISSIVARIPTTNLANLFPGQRAFVVVERGNTNFIGSSAVLAPRFREFRFLLPPTITSVFPNPVRPGDILELRGLGFDHETAREYEVLLDGQSQGIGLMANFGGTRMGFVMPWDISAGSHEIAIRLRGSTSASFPFTVVLPDYTTPDGQFPGYGIVVNQPDFSNVADGKISVLEAFLIIKGQLGRPIEQHPPCEQLPPDDPGYCPPQPRETDFVSGDEPGSTLGPVDTIIFESGMVIPGALPELSGGDRYIFGAGVGVVTLDGTGTPAGTSGMLLDGINSARVSGRLLIQNFTGNGVHLRNGATRNYLEGVSVKDCGGNGFLIEGGSTANELMNVGVTNVTGHGIHLTGAGTERNKISSTKGGNFPPSVYDGLVGCDGNGLRVDNGASFNTIVPGVIRNSGAAGIYVGTATNNFFGRVTDELLRHYDLVNNQGAGAHLGPGAVGNVFRYLNPLNNQGDGVLLQGPGCSNNIVDRTYAGVNLYEGGTSLTIPNQGSGIRLTEGAQGNLIGTRFISLGQHGSISGNRDDGVLLEGPNTAFNTVNAQNIGVLDPFIGVQGLKFSGNGRSGIALRNGAHDNVIGDHLGDLANAIFACPDAGIEIADPGTDANLIYGNQIGAFFSMWVMSTGSANRNRNGIWLHDGPRDNIIGFPGARLIAPRFPGDPLGTPVQCWNAINTCSNAGVLIEAASGTVGTDGVLSGANIIQANHIGEIDNGNLGPSGEGAGIKLGTGAWANVIGGRSEELGNRIRGWYRAGIWIDQNDVPGPSMRNRIENNLIQGPGLGVSFRFFDYLENTPNGGVGVLLTDSSGHAIGESLVTRNVLNSGNRLGIYLANSSSNSISGFALTNSQNAGIVVRGGTANRIGGDGGQLGNLIFNTGIGTETNWSGIALSTTSNNVVVGNEIGRGAIGMTLTNARNNLIGGAAVANGNTIISNRENGVVISGNGSFGNQFFNNFIGRNRSGVAQPNARDGIRIEFGAHDNFIGGLASFSRLVGGVRHAGTVPTGNVIADNLQAGVRVVGGSTTGNRILYNQITSNGGLGIQHESGGNHSQPPPVFLAYDGKFITGNVADLGVTPPGSKVQLFTDPDAGDPEGDAFLGEGVVSSNGTWRVVPGSLIHPIITMTATHAVTGSTSEFGVGSTNVVGFSIARTDAATQGTVPAGATDAPMLLLSLKALNADVRVRSISFDASGSLPDVTAITALKLYRDNDENGLINAADSLLGAPLTFSNDNGRVTFANLNPVIAANSTQRWVVAVSLAPGAAAGASLQLILTNAQVVDAEYINPFSFDATPTGDFAIEGAVFTVGSGGPTGDSDNDGLPDWWEKFYFGDLTRDGTEDFDGDGMSDYEEFLAGTNPADANSALKIIPPMLVNESGVTVNWAAALERIYRLEQRSIAGSGAWSAVAGDVTATNLIAQKIDAVGANQPARFYRIRLVASGDDDKDGLPDGWEHQNFGGLSRNGTEDFDGDGATDAFEFLAGTAANNGSSYLKVKGNPIVATNSVTVEWEANPGRAYRLQFKNALSDANWQTLPGRITATGTTASHSDTTVTGQARRFYRVLLVP